jgi:hypothetical protein
LTNPSETFLWLLPNLFAVLLGLVGLGVLLTRRLPVGDGRALTGRGAILSGLVLLGTAGETLWLNPSLQASTQARTERERMILAEQARAAKNAELEKKLKDVRDQLKTAGEEANETRHRLKIEALDARPGLKDVEIDRAINKLTGKKKEDYQTRLKEWMKRWNAKVKPLRDEKSQLEKEQKELGPPHVPPARSPFREYLPLLLPLLSGLVVFGVGRLFARRDEPVLAFSAPKALPPAFPPKDLVPPTAPLTAPSAGQGPSSSLPST